VFGIHINKGEKITMPEEKNVEETTETESEETEEKESEDKEETKEEPSKKEEEEAEPEPEEEPKKRFPAKPDQTAAEKRAAYWERKAKSLERKTADDFEEDELFDEEEKPITRKELNEILERKDKESASERMVSEFLSENPDYRKYEKRIRKYVNDPDYANVPIGFIASGIVGESIDDEANERAEIKRKADDEAARTKTGGSTKRGTPGKKKSVWDMSKDEFEDYQTEVLHGRE